MTRAQKDVAYRLELTREALGRKPADLSRETGIGPNQWSQFVDVEGKNSRRITLEAAYKLKDEYGITLEWIYDGDRSKLDSDLRAAIRRIEDAGGLDLAGGRWRLAAERKKKVG